MQLKPQDFVVAFKLVAWGGERWTYARMAHELGLSASEAHAAVKRGLQAGLLENNPVWPAPASTGGVLEEPAALYRVRARPRRPSRERVARNVANEASPLMDDNPARVHRANLTEFAVHGARFAFPAQRLPNSPGVPTGRSCPEAARWLPKGEGAWVWPHPQGPWQGQGIEPLHPGVPFAAMQDVRLHEMLALFDALRVGEPGERQAAGQRLQSLLGVGSVE
ncbi:MAG: hypothetical protein AB7S86_08905 [Hydrogenophaga sp.]|uniref:hypothetical protein n=1 Tax=Hydrogenophaga sp. TaxID=1904254 RepID=UPI003D0A8700